MKAISLALVAAFAAVIFSGCCSYKTKCYPYPMYDLSPGKVCGAGPCAVKSK
ncbi:MAG: hypothetical protein ACPL7D_10185 [Candidatus Sumerlaeaceae bacterium]|jgi:hypothetical protein